MLSSKANARSPNHDNPLRAFLGIEGRQYMNQIPLLTIREQRAKRELEISSRVIRQYVKDALHGFSERQAEERTCAR